MIFSIVPFSWGVGLVVAGWLIGMFINAIYETVRKVGKA